MKVSPVLCVPRGPSLTVGSDYPNVILQSPQSLCSSLVVVVFLYRNLRIKLLINVLHCITYMHREKKGMALTVTATFRTTPEIKEGMEKLAKKNNRSVSYYYNKMARSYLEDMEDLEDAIQAMEDLKNGKDRTYTFEEIKKEFGYED